MQPNQRKNFETNTNVLRKAKGKVNPTSKEMTVVFS
jgi:hypothetical protein